MSDEQLKLVETCALLILFDEAGEMSNTDLTKEVGLKAAERRHLEGLGMLDVSNVNRRLQVSLSDKGWRAALDVITEAAPPRTDYKGKMVLRLARRIRRHLADSGEAPAEFFAGKGRDEAAAGERGAEQHDSGPATTDLIRKAYGGLARNSGDPVSLTRVRDHLAGVDRADVDAALVALSSEPDVRIFPESNQKTLTPDDRAAAVVIGNQDRHLITIRP